MGQAASSFRALSSFVVSAGGGRRRHAFALHAAAKAGAAEEVAALLQQADVHRCNEAGCTALHFAAREGHADVASALLAAGAMPDARNVAGSTALHWAADEGHADVVQRLADAGANLEHGTQAQFPASSPPTSCKNRSEAFRKIKFISASPRDVCMRITFFAELPRTHKQYMHACAYMYML